MNKKTDQTGYTELKTDYLVVGSGLAGLYAAHYASQFGKVLIVTKSTVKESNSYWAQGGIAAALDPEDSAVFHSEDTINAGRELCNIEAVDVLVKEGKERILDLIELGMVFDSDEEGLKFGLEGGHSKRRVLHAGGNSTGQGMVEFLISSVEKNENIEVLELTSVTELVSDGSNCSGAWAFNQDKNEDILIKAPATVLATGGASALFERTTNPDGATGEGLDLAYRAGAELMDMEFIQFHPTAFYSESGETFLITEAVRGEGAHLVNRDGKRFMKKYHGLGELAPRDVVSKSIYNEMHESGSKYVYLSLSHLERPFIIKRFSNIYGLCMSQGFDLTSDLIPVAPAAHYTIGGVRTGLLGETNLSGLFACGEVTCTGVHGANRLASNSLLECIVFAKRAIDGANSYMETGKKAVGDVGEPGIKGETDPKDQESFNSLNNEIQHLNTKVLGIMRNGEEIKNYISRLDAIIDKSRNLSGWFAYKILGMATMSKLIAESAYFREESRGAHLRDDFPEENENFRVHIVNRKGSEPYSVKL